jgi:hypothetical protein
MLANTAPAFDSCEDFASAAKEARRLDWLEWACPRAEVQRLEDDILLCRAVDIQDPDRQNVLDELARRLQAWPLSKHGPVAAALSGLAEEHAQPGAAAQQVDRMLARFVHRLTPAAAGSLARACVRSDRLARRRAGWRQYRRHGTDPMVVDVLTEELLQNAHRDLLELAAMQAELLERAGLAFVLERSDEFYWRGRTLATAFGAALEVPDDLVARYPAEALFGLRRSERRDKLHRASTIFRDHMNETKC